MGIKWNEELSTFMLTIAPQHIAVKVMVPDKELCEMSGVFAGLLLKVAGWVESGVRN